MNVEKTGVRVWFYAILINSALFGAIAALMWNPFWIASIPFTAVGGVIAGLPFLLVTIVLIKLASVFPYAVVGKISWVAVILSICVVLFYMLIEYQVDNVFSLRIDYMQLLTGTTIAGIWTAMYCCRRDFEVVDDQVPENKETTTTQ